METKPKKQPAKKIDDRARALVGAIVKALGASEADLAAAESFIFDGGDASDADEIASDLVCTYTSGPRTFVRSIVAALGGNKADEATLEACVFEGASGYPDAAVIKQRVETASDVASASAAVKEDELPGRRALATYLNELHTERTEGETDTDVALRLLHVQAADAVMLHNQVRELSDRVRGLEIDLRRARRAALPAEIFRLVDDALSDR